MAAILSKGRRDNGISSVRFWAITRSSAELFSARSLERIFRSFESKYILNNILQNGIDVVGASVRYAESDRVNITSVNCYWWQTNIVLDNDFADCKIFWLLLFLDKNFVLWTLIFNILRPRQNGRHFADDTYKRILSNENVRISNKIALKFIPKGTNNDIPALVQIMA